MIVTNKYGAPQPLVKIAENDTYTKGHSQLSVTQLIDSPRVVQLKRLHGHKIETDVSDMLWAIVGKAIHEIVERGSQGSADHISEQRVFADVAGWVISGAIDVQVLRSSGRNGVALGDYKFTSAWSVMKEKIEWERQLNCYRWLVETQLQYQVDDLFIFAFIRDWNRHEAARNPDYPQAPLHRVPVKLWSFEQADSYVRGRVAAHQQAWFAADMDDAAAMPLCSDEDRWQRDAVWHVFKKDGKRSVGSMPSEAEARKIMPEGGRIEKRGGQPIRCEGNYCSVAAWCSQYQDYLKQQGIK